MSLEQNFINVRVFKTNVRSLVDTGASISCISQSFLKPSLPRKARQYEPSSIIQVTGVGGDTMHVLGTVTLP